jgi:DNA-binding IclR family transcriptional regulator
LLQNLNADTDETVHLAVLANTNIVLIDVYESSRMVRIASRVGRMVPAHASSMGKAILANLKDEELLALYPNSRLAKMTSHTLKNRADLLADLKGTRQRGYALNCEESEEGLGSIAVAIVDRRGVTQAALSVAAPMARFSEAVIPRLAKAAQRTAKAIGEAL